MRVQVYPNSQEMASQAAHDGAALIRAALDEHGDATLVVATGASQLEMLKELVKSPDIDWTHITGFHLDEYVGLPDSHPASFRRYLRERFVSQLPTPLKKFHYIDGEADCDAECRRLGEIISEHRIDVAFVGIGENGHLAFNDPPADFETNEPYLRVELDEACRRQQAGEGWFPSLESVPREAITMSIQQILESRQIVCTVPNLVKAPAVREAVTGPVAASIPASILQTHSDTTLYLDAAAASLLQSRDYPVTSAIQTESSSSG